MSDGDNHKDGVESEANQIKMIERSNWYYQFFRMGGSLSESAYQLIEKEELEYRACVAARLRMREEDIKMNMRAMTAVFDSCLEKLMSAAKEQQKSDEQIVSAALDGIDGENKG
jgi:hypothetical protein